MPIIVELPDRTEVEFPDGMDDSAIQAEILKAFPDLGQQTAQPEAPAAPPATERAPAEDFPTRRSIIPEVFLPQERLPTPPQDSFMTRPLLDVSATLPYQILEKAAQAQVPGMQVAKALIDPGKAMIEGVTSPEMLLTLPAAAVAPAVFGPAFGAMAIPSAIEGVQKTAEGIRERNIVKTAGGVSETAVSGLVTLGLLAPFHARALPRSTAEVQKTAAIELPGAEPAPQIPQSIERPPKLATIEQQARRNAIKAARPEVPESAPEPQRGLSVIEEIRQSNADTTRKVQELYPHLKREEAAALRRQAFPIEKPPIERPSDGTVPIRSSEEISFQEPPKAGPGMEPQVREQAATEAPAQAQAEPELRVEPPKLTPEQQAEVRGDLAAEMGEEPTAPPEALPAAAPAPPVIAPAQSAAPASPLFTPAALTTPAARTAGLRPASADPMALVQQVRDTFRRQFTVRGDLPEPVMGLKRELDATRNATDFAIRMGERDLMGALKEVYGLNAIEMAGGGSRRVPAAAVQLMNDYLKGNVSKAASIPSPIRSVLDRMRAEIDAQSQKVIGVLTQQRAQVPATSPKYAAVTALIDKIRSNLDVYVHRSYKYFDSEKPAPQWYADIPRGVRDTAEQYLVNNSPAPLTQPQAQSLLLDWLSDLKDTGPVTASGKLGAKDLSVFMRRNVIAPEIRAVLGEYNSPLVNYSKSVAKMGDFVAKQRFLDEVRRKGMGSFLFEEGANPPGFNAEIASESSKVLSPLNGLRTTHEIAEAFKEIDRVTDYGLIGRTYMALNMWSKFAATGLSVMTQARNLLSRPFMAGMVGHWQAGKAAAAVRAIYQDLAGSDAASRAYLASAYKHGVIGDTARGGEMRAIARDAKLDDVSPSNLYSWSMLRAIKQFGYKIPAEVYRLSDELGNIFGWENEKALQREIHPTWTKDQIDAEAARIVRDTYPTYSETPKSIKEFRKVALVGPFVTFPYQMFRTTWNALGQSFHEIRSANPVERKIGYKRLASQMAVLTATYALQEAGKAALGITTQQEDDFRRFQPPWSRNSKYLFVGKDQKKGELHGINLSYMDPYSYLSDPLVAIARNVRSDKPIFEVFAETAKEMFRPWVSEQMLAKSIIEARNGKTDSGREIVNPTDTKTDAFQKQVQHVLKSLQPGTLQRIERRILPAFRNEQPAYGRKLEVGPEIAREVTGVAVEKFSFKNGLAFRAREFADLDKAAESVFHQTLSRTQTTTREDVLNAYKESDARRFLVWKEMRKDFMAAVRQGVTSTEARKLMSARGVSQRDALAIAAGRYVPMAISDQSFKRASERQRQIPIGDIRRFQAESGRRSLDD